MNVHHLRSRTCLAFVALAISAAAWADAPRRGAISEDALAAYTRFLASDETAGRASGERGNEVAARYIADQYRRIGLEPIGTSRQRDPHAKLNGTGYYQPWTFVAGSTRGKRNALEATIAGKQIRYRVGSEFEPSASTADAAATGEVVFAGYGNRSSVRDDYAGLDAKGKIVLVLTGTGVQTTNRRFAGFDVQRKVQAARDAGAAAVVVTLAADTDKPTLNPTARPSDSGLPVVVVRRAVAESWLKAAGKSLGEIEKTLSDTPQAFALGIQASVTADVDKLEKPTANIVGMLPGTDPTLSKECIVIGAHMDHLGLGGSGSLGGNRTPTIHPGADDNASGTAGVIALAEHFADPSARPKRSVVFIAFSGEEIGLVGSAHYVKNPIVPIEKTAAMLNMDMIGRTKDNKLSVTGVGTWPGWSKMLDELNTTASFVLSKSSSGMGGSDHQSFARAQVPVLFFFTGMHPDYHRPSDTVDKINVWDQARVVRFVAAVAGRVANTAERPKFAAAQDPGNTPMAPPRNPIQASLGIMPEYSADAGGVPVGGLRAGGPAEAAGIKAGDVVMKIGDKSVRSIQEYMAALASLKVGDKVSVTFKRSGQEMTVSLVLAESRR